MNTPSAPHARRCFSLPRTALRAAAGCAALLAVLSSGTSAFAQGARQPAAPAAAAATTTTTGDYSENRTDGSAVVVFKEDAVGAGGAGAFGGTILRPPGATRVGLLRPRFNFVSEMLKSVENL